MNQASNRSLAFFALASASADLAVKMLPLGKNRVLIPGLIGICQTQNTGAAFGLFSQMSWFQTAFITLAILLTGWWLKDIPLPFFHSLGAGLMLGGALGNLIDRLLHGAVLDYLELLFVRFPVFNLADAFITLGAVILIACILLPGSKSQP
jgi:signal peptidase II